MNIKKQMVFEDDFTKVEHDHWKSDFFCGDFIIIVCLLLIPSLVLIGSLFVFNDFLICHSLYLSTLVFFSFLYINIRKNVNLDILYISHVCRPKKQLTWGIIWILFAAVLIPMAFVICHQMNFDPISKTKLLIPFGIEIKSKFPKVMHFFYLVFYFFELVLLTPIIEFRYYLVFIRLKIDRSLFTVLIIFVMCLNHSYSIGVQYFDGNVTISIIWAALVIGMYLLIFIIAKKSGIITAIFCQMGIYFGVILVLVFALYTRKILDENGLTENMFVQKNIFELAFNELIVKVVE